MYTDWPDANSEHETQFYPAFNIFRYPKKYRVSIFQTVVHNVQGNSLIITIFTEAPCTYKNNHRSMGVLMVISVQNHLLRKMTSPLVSSQLAVHANSM